MWRSNVQLLMRKVELATKWMWPTRLNPMRLTFMVLLPNENRMPVERSPIIVARRAEPSSQSSLGLKVFGSKRPDAGVIRWVPWMLMWYGTPLALLRISKSACDRSPSVAWTVSFTRGGGGLGGGGAGRQPMVPQS